MEKCEKKQRWKFRLKNRTVNKRSTWSGRREVGFPLLSGRDIKNVYYKEYKSAVEESGSSYERDETWYP